MNLGWIKLHRQIRDHWMWSNADYVKAWLDILMLVNHAPASVLIKGQLYEVARGESVRSVASWAKEFGPKWTPKKVRTFFKLLEADSIIVTHGDTKTSRLTVVSYDTYQSRGNAGVTQEGERGERGGNAGGERRASGGQQSKNDKNDNNDKNNKTSAADAAGSRAPTQESNPVTDPDDIPAGQSQIAELHQAMDAVTAEAPKPKRDPMAGFEKMWDRYEYKEARKSAERSWKKLSDTKKRQACAAAPSYVDRTAPRGKGDQSKQYRKNLATWLNQEGWLDEEEQAPATPAKDPRVDANGIIQVEL